MGAKSPFHVDTCTRLPFADRNKHFLYFPWLVKGTFFFTAHALFLYGSGFGVGRASGPETRRPRRNLSETCTGAKVRGPRGRAAVLLPGRLVVPSASAATAARCDMKWTPRGSGRAKDASGESCLVFPQTQLPSGDLFFCQLFRGEEFWFL